MAVQYYDGIGRPVQLMESGGDGTYTCKCVRNLMTGELTLSALYYDAENNVVLSRSASEDGVTEDVFTAYTYSGKVSRSLHVHRKKVLGKPLTEERRYVYQPATDRLLRTEHSLDGASHVVLAENTYDEVGRLVGVKAPYGNTEYKYNVRSWLTSIDNSNFNERLYYQTGRNPQYGGSPSMMKWHTGSGLRLCSYIYTYDALGRLTAAKYSDDGKSRYNYDTSYEYDCMGNITRLNRRGLLGATRFGDIDKLRYTYHGNQVIKIDDDADDGPYYKGAFHFVDGADEPIEYEYDANGNLTKDLNKEISSIQYNCLNLPQKILFNDNRKIIFSYDAEGNKRSARYYETAMRGDSPT